MDELVSKTLDAEKPDAVLVAAAVQNEGSRVSTVCAVTRLDRTAAHARSAIRHKRCFACISHG